MQGGKEAACNQSLWCVGRSVERTQRQRGVLGIVGRRNISTGGSRGESARLSGDERSDCREAVPVHPQVERRAHEA